MPSQIIGTEGNTVRIAFLANVPSVGVRVYGVQAAAKTAALPTGLSVTKNSLENNFYRVSIDAAGDVASIYDKVTGRELLEGTDAVGHVLSLLGRLAGLGDPCRRP